MKTSIEKIIKREDGNQYRITAYIGQGRFYGELEYRVEASHRLKGKRKWNQLPDTLYEYQFRKLTMQERREHKQKNMLRFVTQEEILEAKLALWQTLKPER